MPWASSSGVEIHLLDESGVRIIEVVGELVVETGPEFEGAMQAMDAAEEDVVLDLSRVTFMDSTGLRLVVSNRDRIRESGHRCIVVAPPDSQVAGLFDFLELGNSLEVAAERSDALAGLRDGSG